ncbi:unnamed protein product [Oncorhynchus mykiss]|uniref:Homeobox domain-containing protein n=1 Tax=Oncorhynchus mykiss TaxID=8022 RepID=A0A060X3J7_ONCMY|nr:unnamed protein product [Oncorhynchus mykiss]
MNFEFEREIGFINSQPSLAECLTSFPAVLESFQTSSIKDSTVIPPPFEHTIPSLSPCTSSQARPRSQKRTSNGLQLRTPQPQQGPAPPASTAGPLAHEFPWMKEKKSSKKGPKSGNATVASSSPSPASSGYATAGLESPTATEASSFAIVVAGLLSHVDVNKRTSSMHLFLKYECPSALCRESQRPALCCSVALNELFPVIILIVTNLLHHFRLYSMRNADVCVCVCVFLLIKLPFSRYRLQNLSWNNDLIAVSVSAVLMIYIHNHVSRFGVVMLDVRITRVLCKPDTLTSEKHCSHLKTMHEGQLSCQEPTSVSDTTVRSTRFPTPTADNPATMGDGGASGPDHSFSEQQDASSLPDLNFFSADSCLQISDALSPSLQSSLDSPVDFSEADFDLFTSTLCTIDLQHLQF